MKKKYIIISGFNIKANNRGTSALGYGSISFLKNKGIFKEDHVLLNIHTYKNPFKRKNWSHKEAFLIDGKSIQREICGVFFVEFFLLLKWGIKIPFSRFAKKLKNVDLVAAINGGDGFSDIYNTNTFLGRLKETNIAMATNIPLIILPQTLGPFEQKENLLTATKILRYAKAVYVRDDRFVEDLRRIGIKYIKEKDLSYYMKPLPWGIEILPHSIGINVSGLAYSNHFRSLSGKFEKYPLLIEKLINCFTELGHNVYLIPHSYNYANPEKDNDDMLACRLAYERTKFKNNVTLIDKDMTSPQIKYIISQMTFFIGTRMHANFAAIYTNVPVFGLAYSYKFKGGFDNNGIDGESQTANICNINEDDVYKIVEKILTVYKYSIR